MKLILTKLFFRHVVITIAIVWLALIALLSLFDALNTADDDTLLRALLLTALRTPRYAMETLPFACAIGATLALRQMVVSGEITALRVAGLSMESIAIYCAAATTIFILIYLMLSEVLLPAGADIARALKNETRAARDIWLRDGNDYIRIQRAHPNGVMEGIVVYHTDKQNLRALTIAESAENKDGKWLLHNVQIVRTDAPDLSEHLEQQPLALTIKPSSFAAFMKKPREMSLHDATYIADELSDTGQNATDVRRILWQRWGMLPALPLLAAAAVWFIDESRRRRTTSLSVLYALLVGGIYFFILNIAVQIAALADFGGIVVLPPLLLAAFVVYGIRRNY